MEVVKLILVSYRQINLNRTDFWGRTVLDVARASKHNNNNNTREVASLLQSYLIDSHGTRQRLQLQLGLTWGLVAGLFAVIVLLCDDYVALRRWARRDVKLAAGVLRAEEEEDEGVKRFFAMAVRLPMELQMLLCHRVHGSCEQNVTSKEAGDAIKGLFLNLHQSPRRLHLSSPVHPDAQTATMGSVPSSPSLTSKPKTTTLASRRAIFEALIMKAAPRKSSD